MSVPDTTSFAWSIGDSGLLHRFLIHPRVMPLLMTAQAKTLMNSRNLVCGLMCWLIALPAWCSYAIYIGKNLTADGSVMIGG